MSDHHLDLNLSTASRLDDHLSTLGDVEAVRLILTGSSVIDWDRAQYTCLEDVDRHLRLLLLEPSDPSAQRRMRFLYQESITYMEEHLGYRIPKKLRRIEDVRQIFLFASDTSGFRRTQMLSCILLKLMHVLYHLEASQLKTQTAVSERDLLDLANQRVTNAAQRMRLDGPPIIAFHGNRKTRSSIITKLISKRQNVAAPIFDKLRFRVVVPTESDLFPALRWLSKHLIPFNQTLPEESHNNLLDPDALMQATQDESSLHAPEQRTTKNEFSGKSYRQINFIIDLPVPLPAHYLDGLSALHHGNIVLVQTEFQVVDAQTAQKNEAGENAHSLYKARQLEVVRQRLQRGEPRFPSSEEE